MIFNFGFNNFENETYIIEIKIGNSIQRQRIEGSSDMIQLQCMQLANQVLHTDQPIRLRIIQEEQVWNQYRQEFKTLENALQVANKKYMETFSSEFKDNVSKK